MPIVINEITVSVEVTPSGAATSNGPAATAEAFSREDIIKECVEKVMEIINQKNER